MTEIAAPDGVARRQADETRERLRTAAAEVFAQKGYEGAGVQEIARRAGLTTGAIYSRYSGKAELLAEAIRDQASPQLDALFATQEPEGKAANLLARAGAHLVTRRAQPDQGILLEAFVAARRDPELQALLRERIASRSDMFAKLIEFGKHHHDIDDTLDTESVVRLCMAIGLGFLLYEAIDMPQPDSDAWQELISRLIDALGGPEGSPAGS